MDLVMMIDVYNVFILLTDWHLIQGKEWITKKKWAKWLPKTLMKNVNMYCILDVLEYYPWALLEFIELEINMV